MIEKDPLGIAMDALDAIRAEAEAASSNCDDTRATFRRLAYLASTATNSIRRPTYRSPKP